MCVRVSVCLCIRDFCGVLVSSHVLQAAKNAGHKSSEPKRIDAVGGKGAPPPAKGAMVTLEHIALSLRTDAGWRITKAGTWHVFTNSYMCTHAHAQAQVKLRGLPYGATVQDVASFFRGFGAQDNTIQFGVSPLVIACVPDTPRCRCKQRVDTKACA